MAEDIKEENEENSSVNEDTNNGLIPEDSGETPTESESQTPTEDTSSSPQAAPTIPTMESSNEEMDMEEDEENPIQKKQNKIQKILIIVAGVLGAILVIGLILYFFGFFDPEEKPKTEMTTETMEINITKEPEKYIFASKDINIDRLNGKLRILTKYEIIGTEEEERQKELEKNSKLSTDQINELLKAEQMKEDEQKKKEEEERLKKLKEEEEKKAKAQNPYDLLQFIQIANDSALLDSIKNEIEQYKVKSSKCEDRNQEFFLIGPFNSNKELNQAFRAIYNNITPSATKKDLARLEFNRICK